MFADVSASANYEDEIYFFTSRNMRTRPPLLMRPLLFGALTANVEPSEEIAVADPKAPLQPLILWRQ